MLYAREVIDLMGAFPGRDFRRAAIVRYVIGAQPQARRLRSVQEAVRRVLQHLIESGVVEVTDASSNGSFALYRWKVPAAKPTHEVLEKRRA